MRYPVVLTAAVVALGCASIASAQPYSGTLVNVSIGPALQTRAQDYGPQEFAEISRDLSQSVQRAVSHAQTPPPVRVDLVIEDAVPNRPTFNQLSRTIGLSLSSRGLGGARISGIVTYADGAQRPVREQFYETDLREERDLGAWSDADRAFDQIAYDIGHGKLRASYDGPGPTGTGHFGYPFHN